LPHIIHLRQTAEHQLVNSAEVASVEAEVTTGHDLCTWEGVCGSSHEKITVNGVSLSDCVHNGVWLTWNSPFTPSTKPPIVFVHTSH